MYLAYFALVLKNLEVNKKTYENIVEYYWKRYVMVVNYNW